MDDKTLPYMKIICEWLITVNFPKVYDYTHAQQEGKIFVCM